MLFDNKGRALFQLGNRALTQDVNDPGLAIKHQVCLKDNGISIEPIDLKMKRYDNKKVFSGLPFIAFLLRINEREKLYSLIDILTDAVAEGNDDYYSSMFVNKDDYDAWLYLQYLSLTETDLDKFLLTLYSDKVKDEVSMYNVLDRCSKLFKDPVAHNDLCNVVDKYPYLHLPHKDIECTIVGFPLLNLSSDIYNQILDDKTKLLLNKSLRLETCPDQHLLSNPTLTEIKCRYNDLGLGDNELSFASSDQRSGTLTLKAMIYLDCEDELFISETCCFYDVISLTLKDSTYESIRYPPGATIDLDCLDVLAYSLVLSHRYKEVDLTKDFCYFARKKIDTITDSNRLTLCFSLLQPYSRYVMMVRDKTTPNYSNFRFMDMHNGPNNKDKASLLELIDILKDATRRVDKISAVSS